MIGSYYRTPFITDLVNKITWDIPDSAKDREIIRAIFYWIKKNIHFEDDETIVAQRLGMNNEGRELLIAPDALLSMLPPSGDCDDFSLLLSCLLKNLHFRLKLVTIACDASEPDRFSHIYVTAYLEDEKKWIPLDTSHGSMPGWEHNKGIVDNENVFRKVEWDV